MLGGNMISRNRSNSATATATHNAKVPKIKPDKTGLNCLNKSIMPVKTDDSMFSYIRQAPKELSNFLKQVWNDLLFHRNNFRILIHCCGFYFKVHTYVRLLKHKNLY